MQVKGEGPEQILNDFCNKWENKGRPGTKARIRDRDLNCRVNSGFPGAG